MKAGTRKGLFYHSLFARSPTTRPNGGERKAGSRGLSASNRESILASARPIAEQNIVITGVRSGTGSGMARRAAARGS